MHQHDTILVEARRELPRRGTAGDPLAYALHYYCARFCIPIQGVDNPDQALIHSATGLLSHPDIHQGERLCGRLLPSILRVSEKNSSRILSE